ncbi:MAG TPA: type VI secretion system-associated FHA domain protein [Planctomycetota bacterium]|nr:type VI secretion system-associated FHA domain protein [Planctomycetota bacterium]
MTVQVVVRRTGTSEPLLERTFELLPGSEISFGRNAENDIAVPDPDKRVSSRHGCIECRADGLLHAVDAGSLNGTYLNGTALDAKTGACLVDGDVLIFGDFELQVVHCGTAVSDGDVDLEATVSSYHAADHCERTASRLEQLYSAELRGDRTTRMDVLRSELRRTLAGLTPQQATAILRNLGKRFAAPVASDADEPATSAEPGAASLDALRRLAARFVPKATLTTAADIAHFAKLIEHLCEATMRWLAQSLEGRGVFGREFGAEVTMVFQRSNNPLKSLSADGLAEYLLDWSESTADETRQHYLEAVLKDLAEHQLGVLAGVREAVGTVVAHLAPERVMALAKDKGGWFTTSKAANAWSTYEQIYAELIEERDKLFHEVISPAIQKGYLHQHGNAEDSGGEPVDGERGKA